MLYQIFNKPCKRLRQACRYFYNTRCHTHSHCETVVIPVHHEMIVPAEVLPQTETNVEVPVELSEMIPQFASHSRLRVARTIVDPSSGQVPVRVANPKAIPLTVHKSTHIGCFYPLQSGEKVGGPCVCVCEVEEKTRVPNNVKGWTRRMKTETDGF